MMKPKILSFLILPLSDLNQGFEKCSERLNKMKGNYLSLKNSVFLCRTSTEEHVPAGNKGLRIYKLASKTKTGLEKKRFTGCKIHVASYESIIKSSS